MAFAEWTDDEQLRQTTFLGWRDDKQPTDVVIERPTSGNVAETTLTVDAAGRIGIFALDLPELLHDAADSS